MRNKSTIYIIISIAFVLALSIGYALCSESISISGTAKAEGEFSIEYSCATGLDYFETKYPTIAALDDDDAGYTSASCDPITTPGTVALAVTLNYPGAKRYFRITAENTGSIDAAIDVNNLLEITEHTACLDGSGNNNPPDGTITNNECDDIRLSEQHSSIERQFANALALFKETSFGLLFEDASHNVYSEDDAEIYSHIDQSQTHLILAPDEKLHIYVKAEFFPELTGSSALMSDHIEAQMTFDQRTAD